MILWMFLYDLVMFIYIQVYSLQYTVHMYWCPSDLTSQQHQYSLYCNQYVKEHELNRKETWMLSKETA